jgi:hypothetical protein
VKLSPTQRAILEGAVKDEDPDFYLANCVYDRNRRGLERAGAIARGEDGRWSITDEAYEVMS